MKAAIKLFLIFILLQLLGSLAAVPLVLMYQFVVTGTVDADAAGAQTLVPGSLLTLFFTVWYLWKKGYLADDGQLYSPVSGAYLLGPVLEELVFRGAITRELLRKFRPGMAIFISGLLFGLIHFNPVQSVFGFLAGMLLAWLYWRTRSVVPCIVVHVLNNALSVGCTLAYPDVDTVADLMGYPAYGICLGVGAVALGVGLWQLLRRPKAPDYDRPYVEPFNTGKP